jgi:hypothetical protein
MAARNPTSDTCPFCEGVATNQALPGRLLVEVQCDRCGRFFIAPDLPGEVAVRVSEADRHLLGGYTREQWQFRESDEKIPWIVPSNYRQILAACPKTVRGKADKLLAAIQRQTTYFGQEVPYRRETDFRLAYAQNPSEFGSLLSYLMELGFIKRGSVRAGSALGSTPTTVVVTARGVEAIESRMLLPPVTVFISSTCYDLMDLRAELAEFLESKGFTVRVSDDPYRMDIEPTEDSIQTCLRNVESADVVVCVLDGRYGPPLPPEGRFSATHVEIQRARAIGRPIYIFGRERALAEFDLLRRNPEAKTEWVEKHDANQRKRWLTFAEELRNLATAHADGHSNWVDPFQTSVQLKKLVLKRLSEYQRKMKT